MTELPTEAQDGDQTRGHFTSYGTTFVIFVTTLLLLYYNTKRRAGVPPGPILLPVVGNLFSLASKDVLKTIRNLRQQYGDVFALYIGTELVVFLNGYEVINEALVKKGSMFVRRPYSSYYKLAIVNPGIVFLNDKKWKVQRTLVLKAFNTLFFKNGGKHLKCIIEHEAVKLVNELDSFADSGAPFELGDTLLVSVANVIADLLFKRNFDFTDESFLWGLKRISKLAGEAGKMQILCNCFPFLAKIPGDILRTDYTNGMVAEILDGIRPYIAACKDDPNTFVGLYCEEMRKIEVEDGHKSDDEKYLEPTTYDLLAAGSESSSTTLLWILLYLMNNPSIQEAMYEEILEVKSVDKVISPDFIKQLPYSNAVIYEAMRLSTAAPLAIPHSVPRDFVFGGYLLPENCSIIMNLNSAHLDPSVWDEPELFRPERFLNQSKTEVVVPNAFIPFSIGQRSCLGESLARMELFVFLTSMIANFKFYPKDENVLYDMEGVLGITWHPKPFQMRVSRRESK